MHFQYFSIAIKMLFQVFGGSREKSRQTTNNFEKYQAYTLLLVLPFCRNASKDNDSIWLREAKYSKVCLERIFLRGSTNLFNSSASIAWS